MKIVKMEKGIFPKILKLLKRKTEKSFKRSFRLIINIPRTMIEKCLFHILDKSSYYFIIPLKKREYTPYLLHQFKDTEYLNEQRKSTKRKILTGHRQTWVTESTIRSIAGYVVKHTNNSCIEGLCHGTRVGNEQRTFLENLPIGSKVLGTELEPEAARFPNTIVWDFHELKDEWVGKFDFVYTNAHDHCARPKEALNNWVKCLNDNGFLFLEHSIDRTHRGEYMIAHRRNRKRATWRVETEMLPWIILEFGEGKFSVVDTIKPIEAGSFFHRIFVIKKGSSRISPTSS